MSRQRSYEFSHWIFLVWDLRLWRQWGSNQGASWASSCWYGRQLVLGQVARQDNRSDLFVRREARGSSPRSSLYIHPKRRLVYGHGREIIVRDASGMVDLEEPHMQCINWLEHCNQALIVWRCLLFGMVRRCCLDSHEKWARVLVLWSVVAQHAWMCCLAFITDAHTSSKPQQPCFGLGMCKSPHDSTATLSLKPSFPNHAKLS